MADRVVKVKLTADISEYTASLAKAAAQTRGLGSEVEKSVDRSVGPAMSRSGEKSGGLLAQGFRSGFVRRSPLIVAGVTAALAAGAPAMLAAAAALFGGVGAIAAAQNLEVRQAWAELGKEVRDGAVEDAAVLVPVYTRMADKIGAAFQRMRPELRDAFEAAGPQIDQFTDSLTRAAENALPGLVRAVERGGPVIEGLGSLMESVGTGISDMFDAMSDDNADAAGQALEALGEALEAALPLLGELLGTGAELASVVLPPVAAALGVVADAAEKLGPLLPVLVAGFTGFRLARSAAGHIQPLVQQLAFASYGSGALAGTAGRASTVLSGLGKALPGVGIGFAAVSTLVAANEQKVNDWAQAILDGGQAAQTAAQQARDAASGLNEFTDAMQFGDQTSVGEMMFGADDEDRFAEAEQAARDLYDAMTPLQQKQQDVTKATNELEQATGDYGPTSDEAVAASGRLAAKQAELEQAQADLEMATHGVTSAMIEQADQALAAIDSGFAYQNSVNQLEDAQAALNTAISEQGAGSEAAQRAQLALEEQSYRTALSFGQQQADLSGLSEDSLEYKRIVQEQMLAKLYELQSAAGPEMAASLQQQITMLEQSGVKLSTTGATAATTAQQMRDLGLKVTQIPGNKTVFIDAPTAEQKKRLEGLGYVVRTLPNGRVYVTADTSGAQSAINRFLGQRLSMQVQLNVARGSTTAIGGGLREAKGGIVHAYASGGFERLRPMQGGVAQVVPKNTWRVIGDNVKSDEAYIPINNDARSHEIFRKTAERMGYNIGREFAGAGMSGGGTSIDYDRLAALVSGGSSRPLVGTIVTQRNETGHELAERLSFLGRTRG